MKNSYFISWAFVRALSAWLALFALGPAVRASTVFSEDFSAVVIAVDPPGEPVTTSNSAFTQTAAPGTNNSAYARIDAEDSFGLGTTNQYLEMRKGSTTSLNVVYRGSAALSGTGFKLAFDFYDPFTPETGWTAPIRLQLGNSGTAPGTRTVDLGVGLGMLQFTNSTGVLELIANYGVNTKHSVAIYGNYTASNLHYGSGNDQLVAPGRCDVWLDNILVGDEILFRNALSESTHFLVGTNQLDATSGNNFDNFKIDEISNLPVPGDFDGDRDVDGADFVIWQTNFPTSGGATLATGDADGDGDVDGADFVVWQTHFPTSGSPGIFFIPEPATISLLIFSVPLLAAYAICDNRRLSVNR